MNKSLLLILLSFIQLEICFAQNKGPGYDIYMCFGGIIPMNDENISSEMTFLNLAGTTASNPGFEVGGAWYYRRIGLNLGFGFYRFELDANKYQTERQNFYSAENITTFITPKLNDFPVFTGLSYYLKINNLYFEPGFFLRLNKTIAPYYADTYFWNDGKLIKNISYSAQSTFRLSYVPAFAISYYYPLWKGYRVGIRISYQYSLSNPVYTYDKTEVDIENKTINIERQKLPSSYKNSKLDFGLVLRFN